MGQWRRCTSALATARTALAAGVVLGSVRGGGGDGVCSGGGGGGGGVCSGSGGGPLISAFVFAGYVVV